MNLKALGLFLLTAGLSLQQADAETAKQPNIVFFLIDDLGWTDVQPFGTTFYETPNIKKLAAESMIFKNAYAACPVCSPTRASIMTGKYPVRTNTTDFFGAPQPDEITATSKNSAQRKLLPAPYTERLALEETTIAEALKKGGYATFFAGKWHLGETEEFWPQNQGFDINKGGFRAGHPKSYFSPYSNPMLPDGPKGEFLTDRLANEACKFISEHKDKPFFAYLPNYSVHIPQEAKAEVIKKYEEKRKRLGLTDEFKDEGQSKVRVVQSSAVYAAMVEAMDDGVGRVIDQLKKEGIYDNTIIIFFSDNGGLSTAEGQPTSNLPLRAGKGWLYEGGIREPLLIRWPGHTGKGTVSTQSVVSTDFFPTLLQMTGQPLMPEQHLDGQSIVPILNGKKMQHRPIFWHYPHYGNQGGAPGSAVLNGDWKLIRWYDANIEELFNVKNDIGEKKNVIAANSAIAEKLRGELDKWLKETKALMPAPSPFYKK
ncbi:MAG: atsA 32 [Sphingobacteriaceae bacterium]|nr:atsA 32 [Sphingobacteriaceae bacterium]